MKCPVDGTELVMSDRNAIEIDYCPQCRGVWLDRGELDKIIERSVEFYAPPPPADMGYNAPPPHHGQPYPDPHYGDPRYDDRRRDDDRHHGRPKKKRRESFLDDLFDFG